MQAVQEGRTRMAACMIVWGCRAGRGSVPSTARLSSHPLQPWSTSLPEALHSQELMTPSVRPSVQLVLVRPGPILPVLVSAVHQHVANGMQL